MARFRALAVALLCALAVGHAGAQSLQRLTVTQLTLAASTRSPRVEVPFDLIVTAKVREQISRLDNVDLPILAEVELLGDQESLVRSASGTTYTERIRVVAHHSGTIVIAPVTLDAVDARNGRPSQFSSNALTLHVRPVSLGAVLRRQLDVRVVVVTVARWVLGLAVVGLVLALVAIRRGRTPPPVVVVPPPAALPPPSEEDRLQQAYAALVATPTRRQIVRIRTLVRDLVGAREDETLHALLKRSGSLDVRMIRLLRALERAAFTHDEDFNRALADVLDALKEMT